jgi:hypothetical protein
MTELSTFETLLVEIGKSLLPLQEAVSSQQRFFGFMLKLGWLADDIPQPLADLGREIDNLLVELQKIVGIGLALDGSVGLDSVAETTDFTIEDISRLENAVKGIVRGIENITNAPDSAFPATWLNDGFKQEFPQQLLNYLINVSSG